MPGNLNWSALVSFRELFGTGFTVSSWAINYYTNSGSLFATVPYTAGMFAVWFAAPGGYIPGGAGNSGPYDPNAFPRAPGGPLCFEIFGGLQTGSATVTLSGTDDLGHAQTFTSAPFILR